MTKSSLKTTKRKSIIGIIEKRVFLGLFLIFFFGFSTFDLLKEKWTISRALANAKSVRLEHYRNSIDTRGAEEIIAAKELAPEEFHRVNAAFPICLDIGCPVLMLGCLFNPHHRIIITDNEGNVTTIKVCFECDHVGIYHGSEKHGEVNGTPFVWMWTVRNFFASEGMPNSPDIYRPNYPVAPETNQAPADK